MDEHSGNGSRQTVGLDARILERVPSERVIARIRRDIQSDLIYAPHFAAIFDQAGSELWDRAYELLKSGKYSPGLPFTISVPKSPFGFTRPGSILEPLDRLVYHALAEIAGPILEEQTDRSRTFSCVWNNADDNQTFQTGGWDTMQSRLQELATRGGYFIKADIASYYERIPQHHLINMMRALDACPASLINLLEELLLAFRQRNSFGIVQGLAPSDLLGNFYLCEIDADCEINETPSARWVDDIYLHYSSRVAALRGLSLVVERLRQSGLQLNEAKSRVLTSRRLIREETELDRLFAGAKEEIGEEAISTVVYGFAVDWEDTSPASALANETLPLDAVKQLMQRVRDFPKRADQIDRFCIPLLSSVWCDDGLDRALAGVIERPHLAKMYLMYASRLALVSEHVTRQLERLMASEELIYDYQRMFVIAALLSGTAVSRETINLALQWLSDTRISQETRAVAAVLAAKSGSAHQKRAVRLRYEQESSAYVRAAILYSSRYFVPAERKTMLKAWGGHSLVNALIGQAVRKLSSQTP